MHYLLSIRALLAAIVVAVGALTATVILSDEFPAAMYISPSTATVTQGGTQQFKIMVKSQVPVNAFAGEVIFDTEKFSVVDISYNTSVANLWVEEPWYNRANNNIYFAGGTTQPGGFVGEEALITVTLKAMHAGDATFSLHNPRILAHDGLGQDVPLTTPLDALFTVDTTPYAISIPPTTDNYVTVLDDVPPLDLNQDGTIGFQDIGVLLSAIGGSDSQYDFTGDGKVTWSDLRVWQELRK
ncbi:MAG: hypothetical protein WAW13_03990 [Minisyncoccia bacterium]